MLFIPLLTANTGIRELINTYNYSQTRASEQYASQILGEMASVTDFNLQFTNKNNALKSHIRTLFNTQSDFDADYPWEKLHEKFFQKPFPLNDVWYFLSEPDKATETVYASCTRAPRRPFIMMFEHLVRLNKQQESTEQQNRFNERLLQRTFGSGTIAELLASHQRSVPTAIIYNNTPSYLLWDYTSCDSGRTIGYFILIPKNQDLDAASYKMAAKSAGLGSEYKGGFVSIFRHEPIDYYFPASIKESDEFMQWREGLGYAEDIYRELEEKGIAQHQDIGGETLYTRLLPGRGHIAFLILPDPSQETQEIAVRAFNWFYVALILMFLIRGLLIDKWPFDTINSRFVIAFFLAISYPAILFLTSAFSYLEERKSYERNQLAEVLTSTLRSFDAGKDYLENSYRNAFSKMVSDEYVEEHLKNHSLSSSDKLLERVRQLAVSDGETLPVAGLAVFDMQGNHKCVSFSEEMTARDFKGMTNFYRVPFAISLRRNYQRYVPEAELEKFEMDDSMKASYQSYGRSGETLDHEIERFRSRPFRTDAGNLSVVFLHEYVYVDGKPQYVFLLSWIESDLAERIIKQNAALTRLRNSEVYLSAVHKSSGGTRLILRPDRSLPNSKWQLFERAADAAYEIGGGFYRADDLNMTTIAYMSEHFSDIVLVAALSHEQINLRNTYRVLAVLIIAIAGFLVFLTCLLVTIHRILGPLKIINGYLLSISLEDYNTSVDFDRKDEIGTLGSELNAMTNQLKERERLSQLLSSQALEDIISNEKSIGAKKLDGVVLVSDIRSFTSICEQYAVSEVTQLLNEHFTRMASVVLKYNGRVYKFIGDAIEVVFVEDNSGENAASRAVSAACEMIDAHKTINLNRVKHNKFKYEFGIGLAYGTLIAGEIGKPESRMDYAIIGETFEKAEKLEALSAQLSQYPLVADQKTISECKLNYVKWQPFNAELSDAFKVEAISEADLPKTKACIYEGKQNVKKTDQKLTEQKIKYNLSNYHFKNSQLLILIVGFLCLIMPFSGFFYTQFSTYNQQLSRAKETATALSEQASAKFNAPELITLSLEEILDFYCETIVAQLTYTESGACTDELYAAGVNMIESLNNLGLKPETFVLLHEPNAATMTGNWNHTGGKILLYHGDEQLESLYEKLLERFARLFYVPNRWGRVNVDDIRKYLPQLVGTEMNLMYLHNDMHARLLPINRQGKAQYIYWQPLIMRNSDVFKALDKNFDPKQIRKPQNTDSIKLGGIVMCIIPAESVQKNRLDIVKKSLNLNKYKFVYKSCYGKQYFSESLDETVRSYGEFDNQLYKTSRAKLTIDETEYEFVFANKIIKPDISYFNYVLVFLVFSVLSKGWYRAVKNEENIASSFSGQLLAGMIISCSIPLTAVYMINEIGYLEQMQTRIQQERINLVSEFDRLERRQFLHERLVWYHMRDISEQPDILKLIDQINARDCELKRKELTETVRNHANNTGSADFQLRFLEMIVGSKMGWNQIIQRGTSAARESSEFRNFFESTISSIFSDLGTDYKHTDDHQLSSALITEMTRDKGLEIFRSLFGTNAYFNLLHAPREPIEIFVARGRAHIMLCTVPEHQKPEAIFYWLYLDSLNTAVRRIFNEGYTEHLVFAQAQYMYGGFKMHQINRWYPEIVRIARWSLATNSPVSSFVSLGSNNCIVEARISGHNKSMYLMGFVPESKVIDELNSQRQERRLNLLFSIIVTILFAVVAGTDISNPVKRLTFAAEMIKENRLDYRMKVNRTDELGYMIKLFNSMAKMLQEKELMSRMVSKTARSVTLKNPDSDSFKGTLVNGAIMYVSVPEFTSYLSGKQHEQIIDELSEYVHLVCKAIMDNGGDIDKVVGEKILAIFIDQSAQTATRRALGAFDGIKQLLLDKKINLPVAAGLHCGSVIAGYLGAARQKDFTIIGDAVNTAARICSKASQLTEHRFLVSDVVINELETQDRNLELHGQFELKGKAKKLNLYRV